MIKDISRLEWKSQMRKIRWANRQKGEKWGKKEMGIAARMVVAQMDKPKKTENWTPPSHEDNIQNILKKMGMR